MEEQLLMTRKHQPTDRSLTTNRQHNWSPRNKIIFRISFIFFGLFCIPLDIGFYEMLWHIDYAHLNYRHLTEIVAFFNPQFINNFSESGFFGLYSYANIPFVLLIAILGGLLWTLFDRNSKSYETLYYWLRVLARYRVAYAAIGWGYKKLFVMQMPAPNIGLLNTEMIDYFAKRLYWEILGIAPTYEVFLGFAEFIGGFLLLFRKTTGVGAAIAFVVFGNIAISNHAYDIGEQVPSACMAMLAFFILWKDLPGIYQLIVKEKDTQITHFYPVLHQRWLLYSKQMVKYTGNFIFVVLFFAFEVYGYTHNDFYKIPNTPALADVPGYYHVDHFELNGKEIPYSPFDTLRWQDVTFEKYSSLSFKVANRPQEIEMFAAGSYPKRGEIYDNSWHFHWQGDIRRYAKGKRKAEERDLRITWEQDGVSGRHWYHYKADTLNKTLYLTNKNRANRHLKQKLHYQILKDGKIILNGINEFNDSIYVELNKVNKEYPLGVDGKSALAGTNLYTR